LALSCVVTLEKNQPIGLCGILKREFLTYPDVGYALLPEAHKKGFGTEIVTSVIEEFFKSNDHPKLHAMVKMGNEASIKLLKKLGFTSSSEISSPNKGDLIFEFSTVTH
jgi:ribosomal-protein-alanine N-acetyltransferase